jgi:pimeloyl-ACP methyl ester carboxylesterase
MTDHGPIRVREYGNAGRTVLVLHGGPGAPGVMAPVARGLADRFRVVEPFQRGSGLEPLTVAQHIDDLDQLIAARSEAGRPALVGSSWGAMLALAYAARHPESSRALVLIGCGTFDRTARGRMETILRERMGTDLRRAIGRLHTTEPDPNERLRLTGQLLLPAYSCDPLTDDMELAACDARAHAETWNDMVRLQDAGVYPAAFAAIKQPVLMLHGRDDPHPGDMIRDGLLPYLPQLEYQAWERCGHYPWLERAVRDDFFTSLRAWLDGRWSAQSTGPASA